MYKKVWCTCKIVVLLIKPIAFVVFPLPSPSSDLKVPNKSFRTDCCTLICLIPHFWHIIQNSVFPSPHYGSLTITWGPHDEETHTTAPNPPPLPGKKYFVTNRWQSEENQSAMLISLCPYIHIGFTVHGNYTLFIRQISFGFNRLQCIYWQSGVGSHSIWHIPW